MKDTKDIEPFFFPAGDHFLSGRIFSPSPESANGKGFIFFYPFAGERIRVHRLFYCFAVSLMQQGYTIFQYDYRGCGESSGTWRENTMESYLHDSAAAVDYFINRIKLEQIGLMGLGFGALLASLLAEKDDRVKFQILWEPVIDMKKYLYEALRVNLATQVSAYREVKYSRKDLIAHIKSGEAVNVDGYEISDPFFSEAEKVNLLKNEKTFSGKLYLLNIVPPKRPLKAKPELQEFIETYRKNSEYIELAIVHCEPFWMLLRNYYPVSRDLFDKSIELIEKHER